MEFMVCAHKPKAMHIARALEAGARRAGHKVRVCRDPQLMNGAVGVFYGVTDKTRFAFETYMRRGMAVYLDNGWFSHRDRRTLRFCWNGAQPRYEDLSGTTADLNRVAPNYPAIEQPEYNRRQRGVALLCLQSPQYFQFMGLPFTQEAWVERQVDRLHALGYKVRIRKKPTKAEPETMPLRTLVDQCDIVVSLNSSVNLKVLAMGVPAYTAYPSSLTAGVPENYPPVDVPKPVGPRWVLSLFTKLAGTELLYDDLSDGTALARMLDVSKDKRRGHWYG